MQISIAARIAAVALAILAIVAFGWHEYKAGEAAGMATVQQKWDRETAQVSHATTVAVQAAASDALANYRAAGASVAQADEHKAQQVAVADQLTKRVSDYAKTQSNRIDGLGGHAASGPSVGAIRACGLDADGLRIWNDANAAANGGSGGSASDSAGSVAK
jgi:hypothetical protein